MQQLSKFPLAFWIVTVLFLVHQLAQKIGHISLPLIDSHFDPFACSVLMLFALQIHFQKITKNEFRQLNFYEIIAAVFFVAVLSEEVFPVLSERFTRDNWDYLAFGIGGLYFAIATRFRAKSVPAEF